MLLPWSFFQQVLARAADRVRCRRRPTPDCGAPGHLALDVGDRGDPRRGRARPAVAAQRIGDREARPLLLDPDGEAGNALARRSLARPEVREHDALDHAVDRVPDRACRAGAPRAASCAAASAGKTRTRSTPPRARALGLTAAASHAPAPILAAALRPAWPRAREAQAGAGLG